MRFAIDTNHASALLRDNVGVLRRAEDEREQGARFFVPAPVAAELYYMAFNSARQLENLRRVMEFLAGYGILDFGSEAAIEYGRIRAELRAAGQPIPTMDLQIAAIARVHDLTLLTADAHFSRVEGLPVQSWLADTAP